MSPYESDGGGGEHLETRGKSLYSCIRVSKRINVPDSFNVIYSFIQHPSDSHWFTAHSCVLALAGHGRHKHQKRTFGHNSLLTQTFCQRRHGRMSIARRDVDPIWVCLHFPETVWRPWVGVSLHNNSNDICCCQSDATRGCRLDETVDRASRFFYIVCHRPEEDACRTGTALQLCLCVLCWAS